MHGCPYLTKIRGRRPSIHTGSRGRNVLETQGYTPGSRGRNVLETQGYTTGSIMTDMETASLLQEASRRIGANESFQVDGFPGLKAWLQGQWTAAVGQDPGTTAAVASWFDRLYEKHTEPQRHYHTVVHLWEMLQYVEALEKSQTLAAAVISNQESTAKLGCILRLATFFHDAIYDPKSAKNEVASAELFDDFCRDVCMEETTKIQVRTLILATEKHQVMTTMEGSVDPILQQHFLDIDMAVLGKDATAYLAYAAVIRKEYAHVPRELYCEKRAEILQGFCHGRIFLSETFHELLEERAEKNLKAEIVLLNSGVIPGES